MFKGREATFASNKRKLSRMNNVDVPVTLLTRLVQCRVLTKEGRRLHVAQRAVRHDLWLVMTCVGRLAQTRFHSGGRPEMVLPMTVSNDSTSCSGRGVKMCWADGWRRAEVVSAVEAALEKEEKLDRLVHSERTPDAVNTPLLDKVRKVMMSFLSENILIAQNALLFLAHVCSSESPSNCQSRL